MITNGEKPSRTILVLFAKLAKFKLHITQLPYIKIQKTYSCKRSAVDLIIVSSFQCKAFRYKKRHSLHVTMPKFVVRLARLFGKVFLTKNYFECKSHGFNEHDDQWIWQIYCKGVAKLIQELALLFAS